MIAYIPPELQRLNQWVCATGELMPNGEINKNPLHPRTGKAASVTDSSTWASFAEASQCGYPLIGFVLSKDDPYCIIDLDDPFKRKDKTIITQADEDWPQAVSIAERHSKITESFETYTELSQSGKGMHIICKGSVPHGVRRDKVEMYSDSRYMICTGVIYKNLPIADCQPLITSMFDQMEKGKVRKAELVQVDGHMSDQEVLAMASGAANAEKFNLLWSGNWKGSEWPSQSEADYALMAMLCYYSKDNEQCRRLFRASGLARIKSNKNDRYLNYALEKIRGKELQPVDITQLIRNANEILRQGNKETSNSKQAGYENYKDSTQANEETEENDSPAYKPKASGELKLPSGLVGDLAEYFYQSAIRPVKEVSLAAAIALVAGIAGRAYNISGTGLNQYIIVLAKTGSGKEGAATGIDSIIQATRMQVPNADDFIGPGAFASGQALIRVLDKQPCFVSILGEIGLTLQQLCSANANAAQVILKKVLLDIYAKSGFTKILRSSVYSDSEKNTKVVQAPNVTIFGESTPEAFYDGLDGNAIAQGLIPRFSIFEYEGPRPRRNPHAFFPPPQPLCEKVMDLMVNALTAMQQRACCPVQTQADAESLFDRFDRLCDDEINGSNGDVAMQLWNRAHLKSLKLAALLAVGENPNNPVITPTSAAWAIEAVSRDVGKLLAHFQSGDVGVGDTRLEADVKRAFKDYLGMKPKARAKYGVADRLKEKPLVPIGYLRRRLRTLSSFRNDRRGCNKALAETLRALCDANEIVMLPQAQGIAEAGVKTPLYGLGEEWHA